MAYKKMSVLLSVVFLIGCGVGNDNAPAPFPPTGGVGGSPVGDNESGEDLSGTYRETGVICLDREGNLSATARLSSTSSPSTTTISRNRISTLSFGSNSCRVSTAQSFLAKLEEGSVYEGGWGSLTFGDGRYSVTNPSSCKIESNYEVLSGNITPNKISQTVSNGQHLVLVGSVSFFWYKEGVMAIPSAFQVVGRSLDKCYIILERF